MKILKNKDDFYRLAQEYNYRAKELQSIISRLITCNNELEIIMPENEHMQIYIQKFEKEHRIRIEDLSGMLDEVSKYISDYADLMFDPVGPPPKQEIIV